MLHVSELRPETITVTKTDEKVIQLLDRITYRRIRGGPEMDEVHHLRQVAYARAKLLGDDLLEGTAFGADKYDGDPNCYNIGVYESGRMVGCLRLHAADLRNRSMPSETLVPDLINSWLDSGRVLIDSSRFSHVDGLSGDMRMLPFATLRLCAMASVHFNADYSVQVVHKKHAPFYERLTCSEVVEVRDIVFAGKPITVSVLLSDIRFMRGFCYSQRAFFLSSRAERAALFGPEATEGFVKPSVRQVVFEEEDSGY